MINFLVVDFDILKYHLFQSGNHRYAWLNIINVIVIFFSIIRAISSHGITNMVRRCLSILFTKKNEIRKRKIRFLFIVIIVTLLISLRNPTIKVYDLPIVDEGNVVLILTVLFSSTYLFVIQPYR